MSRFGLRSHTDTTTTYDDEFDDDDEDENVNEDQTKIADLIRIKPTTTSAAAAKSKRAIQSKQKQKQKNKNKKKSLILINKDDENDAKLIATTTNVKNKSISLMCSLPLTRLSGILQKLQLTKNAKKQAKYLLQRQQDKHAQHEAELLTKNAIFDSLKLTTFNVSDTIEESSKNLQLDNDENIVNNNNNNVEHNNDDVDEEEKDENNDNDDDDDGEEEGGKKLLCLYCDKKFMTEKLQVKHVDKFHIQQRDRRFSARNSLNLDQTKNLTTTTTTTTTSSSSSTTMFNEQQYSSKRTTTTTTTTTQQQQPIKQINFPGCTYCKNNNSNSNKKGATTTTATTISTLSSNEYNLNSLFLHLIECHADKYFGCQMCIMRFATKPKLIKHMRNVHNKKLPLTNNKSEQKQKPQQQQQQQQQSDTDAKNDETNKSTTTTTTTSSSSSMTTTVNKNSQNNDEQQQHATKRILRQTRKSQQKQQQPNPDTIVNSLSSPETTVASDERRLSRLGLAQNRFHNNNNNTKRKGLRLRREVADNETTPTNSKSRNNRSSTTTTTSTSASPTTSTTITTSPISVPNTTTLADDSTTEVLFRMPLMTSSSSSSYASTTTTTITTTTTTNCATSFIIDDNFYKEVVNNVRTNLLYYLDGKITEQHASVASSTLVVSHNDVPAIRSTLVRSPIICRQLENQYYDENEQILPSGELHAATSLSDITAFPTLLTAEQYGDESYGKLRRRRPHTKHSWKWKWHKVKKYKLISEGGRVVKKMKPPLGLRDLSKLDMWTQLTMRQKHEQQQHQSSILSISTTTTTTTTTLETTLTKGSDKRAEKFRLNEELNAILDKRLLPQIMLEQNEQAVIKLEATEQQHNMADDCVGGVAQGVNSSQTCPENFLLLLNLCKKSRPFDSTMAPASPGRLVLSGEWARPRCYMCMCCGSKFDKLKSLEEHKMFRHAHIYCTHYEVVGRELLANNLLRHLFLPRRALSRYNTNVNTITAMMTATTTTVTTMRTPAPVEDESSDSMHSMTPTTKTITPNTTTTTTISSSTTTTTTTKGQQYSPTYSLQSCSSASFRHTMASLSPITTPTLRTPTKMYGNDVGHIRDEKLRTCSKCQRRCNGSMDLYRHMLDCSGDYIWSMVKKRKYRYYCGSKKRRACNKYLRYGADLRKTPKQPKTPENLNDEANSSSGTKSQQSKNSPTPRQRPSDAESIKKMLENLPAKRVCKQIFPMDKRVKNNKNNQRGSLLKKSMHQQQQRSNLYKTNVLRQTRARQQMAQAAKILSKTKNKKQQQQIKKVNKMPVNKKALGKTKNTTTSTSSNAKKSEQEKEPMTAVKKPKQITKGEPLSSATPPPLALMRKCFVEIEKMPPSTIATLISPMSIKSTSTTITTTTSSPPISSKNDEIDGKFEYGNSNASSSSACTTNTISSVMSAMTTTTTTSTPMTTRKRSKRISDCIAMLTGKLEEKLKTEQNPSVRTNKRSSTNNNQIELKLTTTVSSPTTTIPATTIVTISSPETPTISLTQSKTPKRKAQSRRIIKAPSIENTIPHVDLTLSPTLSSPVTPTPTTTTTISKFIVPMISVISTTTTTTIMPTSISTSSNIQPNIITSTPLVTMVTTTTQQTITPTKPKSNNIPLVAASVTVAKLPVNLQPITMPNNSLALMGTTSQSALSSLANHNAVAKTMTVAATSLPLISAASHDATKVTPLAMPMVKITPTSYAMPVPLTALPMHMPMTLPLIPAHLEPPSTACGVVYNVNNGDMDQPLNLSSSAPNGPIDTNMMLGMPTYHVDSFDMFPNMDAGPLDLSTKCHTKTNTKTPSKENNQNQSPVNGQQNSDMMMPLALTVTSTAGQSLSMFNKQQQYYSNLDLLKIPQIRTTTTTTTTTNMSSIAPITTATTTLNNPPIINMSKFNNNHVEIVNNNNNNAVGQMLQNTPISMAPSTTTTKATMIVAPIIKKRGCRQHNLYDMSSLSSTNHTTTTRNTISTSANMIAPTTTSTVISPPKIGQKKEYASRYKPPAPLTMNEEIINHIDDAINSVINAVKASLSPERCDNDCVGKMFRVEACKPLQAPPPPPLPMINAPSIITTATTTTTVITAPATVGTSTLTNDTITTTITSNTQPLATILPVKRRGRSKAGDNSLPDVQPLTQPLPSVASSTQECTSLPKITTTTTIQNVEQEPQQQHQPAVSTDIMTSTIMTISTSTPTVSIKPRSKVARSTVCLIEDISDPVPAINTKISQIIEEKISEKVELPMKEANVQQIARSSTPIKIISSPTTTTAITTTKTTPTTVEAVSPIVENVVEEFKTTPTTTPIETTTTTATKDNGENVPNNGKKCRRRRKNELAAIVADQLLESFKLDKARRDNLKKLENLAYEKSDDLFMTGMLLMSSTKRSVTLNNSQKQKQQQNDDEEEDKAQDDKDKKPNEENENIDEMENYNNKRTGLRARTTRQSNNNSNNKANNINNKKIEEIAKPKDGRRRAYRRRGKTLDNENIIKLKSSLETFSIGIERQLSEFEAKRERLNDNKSSITSPNNNINNNSKIGSIKVKPCSVILRPSILAASIESQPANIMAPLTAENVAKVSSSAAADNGKSSAFSCRDPRLNKNIHKELSETDRQESKADGVDSGEEEDNYLTEIAKNVNEKIMENEDFMFANDDGLLGLDDTQSSHFYSRPPTSMSVRSAPNFDDRSNYGSMCGDDDEITNTEVMDMDLDDDMSVYTTYSQDVGRGGRRRRRRRRSILLTRRPKKRINRDSEAEKFECTLCKKIFFSATSLSKHNMTLAHVSKVSEQEYLLSRASMLEQGGLVAMANELPMSFPKSMNSAKASKAGASRGRAKTPTPTTKTPRGRSKTPTPTTATTAKGRGRAKTPTPTSNTTTTSKGRAKTPTPTTSSAKGRAKTPTPTTSAAKGRAKTPTHTTTSSRGRGKTPTPIKNRNIDNLDQFSATTVITPQEPSPTVVVEKEVVAIVTPPPPPANESHAFGTSPHLTLNPDERLFFECCTILKGTDTPRPSHNATPATPTKLDEHQFAPTAMVQNTTKKCHSKTSANTFRDPSNYNNKSEIDRMSPNYPGISQLSAVTNTSTFRIKTKAAMKGYENVDMSLPHDLMVMNKPHHHPHQTTCKLTELADIALGSEKTDALMASRHLRQDSDIMRRGTTNMVDVGHKATPDSSTSSKTIMHSSIMQPVVAAPKIVIPERPFKNIGLEEKEAITFQKPRTTSLCLLKSGASSVVGADICLNVATPNDDNNSITTASFSDRDDFDFNSISCDEDDDNVATNKTIGVGNEDQDDSSNCGRVKTPTNSNEHAMLAIPPPGLSESSSSHGKPIHHNNNNNNHDHNSESGAAKTFENKSLIMGRIFKNNTTKVPAPSAKPKNALPKADLNQLFDELRGDCQKSTNNNEVNKTSAMPIASAMKSNPEMLENVEKLPKNAFAKKMSPEEKKSMPKKKVTINLPSATTSRANSPTNTVTKKKVGRKPKANKKTVVESPKEKPPKITKTKRAKKQNAKAQDELAIEQLIDEGQRKSKRRCAANSAKKFVETWSSDEYEEFLSTKDVIALIEEKEKQELEKKKKKKVMSKNCEQQDMELNVQAKENYAFATPQVTTTTMVNPKVKQKKTKDGKKKKDKKNDEQTKITPTANKEIDDDMQKHNTGSNVQSLWNYNTNNNRKRKHKHGNHGEMELSTASSGIVAAESYIMPMGYNDMIGSATRPCMLITEQQQQPMQQQLIQQPLQLMNPFGVTTKPTSSSSSKHYHHHKSSGHHSHHHHNHHSHHHKKHHKERKNVKRKIILDSTDSMPIKQIMEPPPLQPPPPITTTTATMSSNYRKRGRKRKCETKTKHSRRKREKRYYWSSSSSTTSSSSSSSSSSMSLSSSASESDTSDSASDDSDIDDDANEYAVVGTTNDHVIQPAKLSYQPQQQYAATNTTTTTSYGNGEHMQKHGWIVGDSHKKLVTMLAIAKGSNKNNNNNGSSSGSSTVSPKKVTKKKNSKKKMRQD